MHPSVASAIHHVRENPLLLAAFAFVVLESMSQTHGDLNRSMVVSCISWLALWVFAVVRVDVWFSTTPSRRKTSWLAGGLLAFSKILDRVAGDREGTWATKSLLPFFVVLLSSNELVPKFSPLPTHDAHQADAKDSDDSSTESGRAPNFRILAVLVISASIVLGCYAVPQTTALGTSSIIFAAAGLATFHEAIRSVDDDQNGAQQIMGSHAPDISANQLRNRQQLAVLRDVGGTIMVLCGIATCLLEIPANGTVEWIEANIDGEQKIWHPSSDLLQGVWMLPVGAISNFILFILISQKGAVPTSILTVLTHMSAKLYLAPSFFGLWFGALYVLSSALYLFGMSSSSLTTGKQSFVRTIRRATVGIMVLSIVVLVFSYMTPFRQRAIADAPRSMISQPALPFAPVPVDLSQGHPAAQLIDAAEHNFDSIVKRQSSSLPEAVREYRRRNGISPPPHFEKWYEFAVRNNVVMIDEFDLINDMLRPFWALTPSTIRSRITRELGGEDSALLGVSIRNGAIINVDKGDEWQQEATRGMLKSFVQYLPDMDLGFNTHDEPRVVVPTVLLSQMVKKARDEVLPRVARKTSPRNAFSSRPEDMNDGKRFTETYVSNLNRFAHQQTWTQARLSCPLDSQSQTYEDSASDNVTAYAVGALGYLYNTTAFSDICISPSFSSSFGFFERPNAFSVVHELTPIFSQSKISSFQDILYPSPWYWASRVKYDAAEDTAWDNKTNSLYWRGSTTGGFSRNSGWRRQHRQHIVQQLNAPDTADIIISDPKNSDSTSLSIQSVKRRDYQRIIDVHFSHVGQCDPSDCDAQKEFFHVTDFAQPQNAWYFKHLLDMDGNAFSGRFYSFLKSRSLTYKMAVFREWHEEWVKPWVHYIPFSLKGDEHLDLVNWFAGNPGPIAGGTVPNKEGNSDSDGEKKAREIATRSTEWHDKVLRNVDMEVWFFRLLLEYGRVIDDSREEIGYAGP